MRRNLLNWCYLVSISKKLRFYVFGVVRIYYYLADLLQKQIMMKNTKPKFSEYMQNISSRSKSFGIFVLIVSFIQIPNIYLGLGFEFGPQRVRDLAFVCP